MSSIRVKGSTESFYHSWSIARCWYALCSNTVLSFVKYWCWKRT